MITDSIKKIRLFLHPKRKSYFAFYRILGFFPKKLNLYEEALLHKSSSKEKQNGRYLNNERLEFLGDAILDAVVADLVFQKFKNKNEGFLTNTRSKIVKRETLDMVARNLGLNKIIVSSLRTNSQKSHILGNALEALIGAIYLDSGIDRAKAFILKYILNDIENKQLFYDSKTTLQEITQGINKGEISYLPIKEEGPDHNKTFTVQINIGDKPYGEGAGRTKKAAEQMAAYQAICKLRQE